MEPSYHISSIALSFNRLLLQDLEAAKTLNATSLIHHIDIYDYQDVSTRFL
ncbi:hypothetical protein FACS1894110_19970 [Spirochaetia bacterium]|nr:hypothetical protein FACS1894110_19970 [Spirochaetia bacterium]